MSDVSSVTNHFPTANEGFITTLSGTILAGATTVPLNSVSGLTNGSVFVGIIEPGEDKEQVFTGTVDTAGIQITDVVWTKGNNVGHTAGVTVVDYVTSTHFNMVAKGELVHADQDGTLKAGAVDNAAVLADSVVTTAKINDGAVTPAKLALGQSTSEVDGAESTSSTSFVALTTPQAVTVTVPSSGTVLVSLSFIARNTGGGQILGGVELSGANTVTLGSAGNSQNEVLGYSSVYTSWGFTRLMTGLTPGSTTFTAKYLTTASTANYHKRKLIVIPLC